jgi:hypothetical protein
MRSSRSVEMASTTKSSPFSLCQCCMPVLHLGTVPSWDARLAGRPGVVLDLVEGAGHLVGPVGTEPVLVCSKVGHVHVAVVSEAGVMLLLRPKLLGL